MQRQPQRLEIEAQKTLDEMWEEKLTPFKLNIGKFSVESEGYLIEFHDSRIHSVRIPLAKGRDWKELVRQAVLERVSRMSGPLT